MKGKFTKRSSQDELLDSPNVSPKLLIKNLRELDFLNRLGGGHAISLEGIKMLLNDKSRTYHIADLGCGSGDWLRYLARWGRRNGYKFKLIGIDRNPVAISYMEDRCLDYPEISAVADDYKRILSNDIPADIIHSSLFCHHLDDKELVLFMKSMYRKASLGLVINDIKRTPGAYYGARLITTLFRGSKLSRHDGPISVLRGFKRPELEAFLKKAGIANYSIKRRRGFRYLIVAKKKNNKATG